MIYLLKNHLENRRLFGAISIKCVPNTGLVHCSRENIRWPNENQNVVFHTLSHCFSVVNFIYLFTYLFIQSWFIIYVTSFFRLLILIFFF
jgi:hypothetical protein